MIPLISIGWIANKEQRDDLYQPALNQMQSSLQLVTYKVDGLMTTAITNMELFANSSPLKQYVRSRDEKKHLELRQSTLLEQFHSYQQAYPEYYEIRLLRPDGFEDIRAMSSEGDSHTEDKNKKHYFQRIVESEADLSTEIRRATEDGKHAFFVFQRLQDLTTEGQVITSGYLGLTVSLQKLFRELGTHEIDHQGKILLVDRNGEILFDTHNQATNTRLPVVLWRAVQSGACFLHPRRYYFLGQQFLIQAKALNSHLYALVAIPHDELEDPLIRPRIAVILATLSVLILYTMLVYDVLQRLVLRPLKQLNHAVNEIANGNFHPTINIRSRDELGAMAEAIHKMGQQLERSAKKNES